MQQPLRPPTDLDRQAQRLLQVGGLLVLGGLLIGLAIPHLAVPRLALSAHLLGVMQGLLLLTFGSLWPRLGWSPGQARIAHVAAIYGCVAALSANLLGAAVAAGGTLLPIASGGAIGTHAQELAIKLALRSGGMALIVAAALVAWGLRAPAKTS